MTGAEILDLPMQQNDAEAETVRDYLKALLFELFREGEGFSGKRPFGNSGWECDLYKPLIVANFIKGKLDEDEDVESCDYKAGDVAIFKAIAAL